VERINIVEPDGSYRMVLSNRPRSIGPIYKGKPFGYAGGTRPGIIFFNDEGTENGGLTFTGSRMRRDDTGPRAAGRSTSSTRTRFSPCSIDNNGQRRTGFTVADRAERNIYDLVMQRDSINAMPDTAARRVALEKLMGPVNGVPLAATRLTWDGTWRKRRGQPLRSAWPDPPAHARRFVRQGESGLSR
jgi:hypothetical protein